MAKGATEAFFRDSQIEIYQNLWNYMESHPEDQVTYTYLSHT